MTDIDRLGAQLRQAMPPMRTAEPIRDLWPHLRARVEERGHIPWFDVALGVAAVAAFLLLPRAWLVIMMHL